MRGTQNENQSGNTRFFGFNKGKFIEKAEAGAEGAVAHVLGEKSPNAGQTVYRYEWNKLTGELLGIEIDESGNYGKQLLIWLDITEDGEPETKAKISLKYTSSFARRFMNALLNMDISKDITLKGFAIPDDKTGETRFFLTPYQGGNKVANFYDPTAEDTELPKAAEVEINGQKMNDYSAQSNFLFEAVSKMTFKGINSSPEVTEAAAAPSEDGADLDNIPF